MAGQLPPAIDLPMNGDANADPRRPSLEEAMAVVQDATAIPLSPAEKLQRMAGASGDISSMYDAQKLTEIGMRCVANYERDKRERKDWEEVAREALDACSQEESDKAKNFPWEGASNMRWPLLTIAAMQFNARMYPAVVKGDEAVLCKVIGQDNGKPKMGINPNTRQLDPIPAMDPQTGRPVNPPTPQWEIEPGAKAKRARRVSEYLNTVLFYRMSNWEDDTDQLLMELPAVGCKFRKVWTDEHGVPRSETISALNVIVPMGSRDVESALRITQEIENQYPHEIEEKFRSGFYRRVDLGMDSEAEDDGARTILEQHCRWDFDEDGIAEPYIVTLDKETALVLRIEPNFGPADIEWMNMQAIAVRPRQFFVKYGMFPHPKGKFYDLGLGHLLKRLSDGVNTMLNQMIDAGTAAVAGGGFIGSGIRLQSRGGGGVLRWRPGEYKTVDVSGDTLRQGIFERTLPQINQVQFNLLDMILGAARDIAGIKDVMTGEASNQGQVGTTLALIEQGLQVFNSCAKRIFRALKADFTLLYNNIATYGSELAARDYLETLDDPEANFEADFALGGLDIRPVSDPASVTRMQKMAKAQFRLGLLPQIQMVGGDAREVVRRTLEAIDEEDIDKILPPPTPPDPMQQQLQQEAIMQQLRGLAAKADKDSANAQANWAKAMLDAINAAQARFDLTQQAGQTGMEMGAKAAVVDGTIGGNGAMQ